VRAIVVGTGIGGLMCARALSGHADEVLMLDRDDLPSEPSPRKGVGQGAHPHALLEPGRRVIETMLPGFFDDLTAAGARPFNLGRNLHWHHNGSFRVECDLDFDSYAASRPFLEHHLRRRVLRDGKIELRERTEVTGLRVRDGRVVGVTARPAGSEHEPELLDADIVIDAAGRGSKTTSWLQAAGFSAPPVT